MPVENSATTAVETLLIKKSIIVGPKAYLLFLNRLDLAPAPNAALQKTMQIAASWEHKGDLHSRAS
ncbi:DUF1778 domain-containing protein [Pseudescherichia vulneris]|uniref:type II toxin -antitoxin system TacA 1-like antitoxin n=1 Tax=Pseudescherichia vulneris TaxID=566 RepID=UPI0036F26DB8